MKRFLVTSVLLLQGFAVFAQAGSLAVYTDLYNKSPNWQSKLAVLRDMTAAEIPGAADFYASAFNELTLVYRNIKTGSTEWTSANNIAHILIAELVAAQRGASGNDIWRAYEVFTDSTVQAEALVALGELKVDAHYADVERVVSQLNAKVNTTNRQNDENIAAGGFTALEKYGNPRGYLAAFAGAEGWYREFVKQAARSAVSALLQDPSLLLADVIQNNYYSNQLKQRALEYIDASSLGAAGKGDAASKSLVQGWRLYSNDQRTQRELTDFRRLCLQMIRRYGADGAAHTYQAMGRSLREGTLDEKLDVIPALGALKTPEASKIILDYVQVLNDNRRANNSQSIDDRLMRSLIPAMMESGGAGIKDMLYQVQSAPWSNTVLGLTKSALEKLET